MATNTVSWLGNLIDRRERRPEPERSADNAVHTTVSLYPLGENHPLASVLGAFDDEPLWDEWMMSVAEYRQLVTAREQED